MIPTNISRREALALGGAALGSAFVDGPALARAPMLEARAPAFYSFPHGDMQLTVISDGPIPLGDASKVMVNTTKDELTRILNSRFQSVDALQLQQNALIVNTGDKLVLIDTGLGPNKLFGPQTGQLATNLAAAGIDPKSFDAVLISHGHADHVGGLVTENGERVFPNAEIHITKADFDFWTNESVTDEQLKGLIAAARRSLLPYKEQMSFIEGGKEVVPGIVAVDAPGHTVGHAVFMITSGGKTFCNGADLAHHPIIIVERPDIAFAFDTDKQLAVATRKRMFDMLATDRIPMLAYHFPWPGFGHIAKDGAAYRFHPEIMDMMPLAPRKT